MKKGTLFFALLASASVANLASAQDAAPKEEFKQYGKVTGYAFGEYAYKVHADSAGRGNTQYAGLNKNYNSFNFRRIYFGYDYFISENFSTQLTLAHESGFENGGADPSLLSDTKRGLYIKYANLKWKNVFHNADLVLGQQATSTFATLSEVVWGYRSVEKTIADQRGISSSTDLGIGLFGKFDNNMNYGYDLIVANGNGSKLENNSFKKVYTSLYGYFFNKHLILQGNYEYERTQSIPYYQSKTLYKGFLAYTNDIITVGVEAYMQVLQNAAAKTLNGVKDTSNVNNIGISGFVRGRIIKDKLNYFARYDMVNPDTKYNYSDKATYLNTSGNTQQQFITAGLDYTPVKNVHVIPNIWVNTYHNQADNATGKNQNDYDMVARVTLHYIFK